MSQNSRTELPARAKRSELLRQVVPNCQLEPAEEKLRLIPGQTGWQIRTDYSSPALLLLLLRFLLGFLGGGQRGRLPFVGRRAEVVRGR